MEFRCDKSRKTVTTSHSGQFDRCNIMETSSTHPSSLCTCRGPGGNKGQRGQCFKEETLHLLYLGGKKGGGGSGSGGRGTQALLSPCDSHKLPPAPRLGIRIHTHEWTDTSATLSPAPSLFHKTLLLHLLPTPVSPKVSAPSTKISQVQSVLS